MISSGAVIIIVNPAAFVKGLSPKSKKITEAAARTQPAGAFIGNFAAQNADRISIVRLSMTTLWLNSSPSPNIHAA